MHPDGYSVRQPDWGHRLCRAILRLWGVIQLNLAFAPLNQDKQNYDEENSCHNANKCWGIHAFSYRKVDKIARLTT